jgi:hypothetical protein
MMVRKISILIIASIFIRISIFSIIVANSFSNPLSPIF